MNNNTKLILLVIVIVIAALTPIVYKSNLVQAYIYDINGYDETIMNVRIQTRSPFSKNRSPIVYIYKGDTEPRNGGSEKVTEVYFYNKDIDTIHLRPGLYTAFRWTGDYGSISKVFVVKKGKMSNVIMD